MLVLVVLPALLSFALAFTSYDALSPPTWRGLRNFPEIFANPLFWMALRNSAYFVLLAVPLRVLGALALALLLRTLARGGLLPCGGVPADGDPRCGVCADLGCGSSIRSMGR